MSRGQHGEFASPARSPTQFCFSQSSSLASFSLQPGGPVVVFTIRLAQVHRPSQSETKESLESRKCVQEESSLGL
jgi:hypothetical protein